VLIVANPAAGRWRSRRRRLGSVVAALERRGCRVTLRLAGPVRDEPGRLAREAGNGFDVVVAAGGDGTINVVANGIAGTGCALALLPFGTANVLARQIGLPRRVDRLADIIAFGQARPVWPGVVRSAGGERLFLTSASSGFDALTVAAVSPRLKRWFGRLAFVWAILGCLWHYRAAALTVRADGVDYHASTAIAVRGRFYAGGFTIAPEADPGEPILHLALFQRDGRAAVLRYLAAMLFGRLPQRRDIVFRRAREAAVSAAESLPVQADGELVGELPAGFGIAERPLYLVQAGPAGPGC